MTPGTHNITIYRGAAFRQTFTLTDQDGVALDLSGLGPFVAQVREKQGDPILVGFAVDDTDAATGVLVVSATGTQTEDLALLSREWGLMDAEKNLYVVGSVTVKPKIPA